MAITILPQEQSLGGQLGQAVGGGLSGLLQGLAQDKAKKLQQQSWQTTFNLPPEVAQSIANLPPQAQQEFIKNYYARGGIQPAQQQQAMAEQQALAAQQGTQKSDIMQGLQGEQQDINQIIQQLGSQQPTYPAGFDPKSMTYTKPAKTYEEFQQRIPEKQLQQQRARQRAEEDIEIKRQRAQQGEKRIELADKKANLADTKEVRNKIYNKRRTARKEDKVLDEILDISRSDELNDPRYIKFLEMFKLDDVGNLITPATERYRKLQQTFLGNLKDFFGARISNQEMENYLKGIPTLMTSKAGREQIVRDMKLANKAAKAEGKILDDIMEEYGDNISRSQLERELDRRLDPVLDKIYAKTSFAKNDVTSGNTLQDFGSSGKKYAHDEVTGKWYQMRDDGKIVDVETGEIVEQ